MTVDVVFEARALNGECPTWSADFSGTTARPMLDDAYFS
jgi:hypothetical protein